MLEIETPMTPSELFCRSQGTTNYIGRAKNKLTHLKSRCHWCSTTTDTDPKLRHDDTPPMPFTKSKWKAQCPAEAFICWGCHQWRKGRSTITYLNGTFKDSQEIPSNSWFITSENCLAISDTVGNLTHNFLNTTPKSDYKILAEKLLHPPSLFVLCFKGDDKSIPNWLHLCKLNENKEVTDATPLYFTVANIPYMYTVYELGLALRKGSEVNQEPGTAYLTNLFRPFYPLETEPGVLEEDKRGKGRPKNDAENRPGKKV